MARRKTGDKKLTRRKVDIPKVQADDHSIAFEELHIGGNVSGDIRIGHTIGYTADQVSVLLKQITTTLEPKKFDGRCPYKGLEVFEEEDAELFFGRERLVNELVGRVKESQTVFITGPSGSGKSSLVRAGLIHALKNGAIKSSDRWLYETMKPGREPIKDLALAFSRFKSPELEDYFLAHAGETEILNKCAESVLSGRKDQRFVLFVDQFEEVFTQINSEEERVAFINMLAHAGTIENGRVIVLFAMRSDFVSNCATYPALNELLSQEFRQIGAMQPEELVSAIALPARHVGLPVEHELIAQIINDMRGEPDALPLMQFALKDLFDAKQAEGGVIALTLKDYLGHGGIHKSLERHADATFGKLSESEQELTRSIFSGLIEIGRGTQDTKRTALFDELIPANTKPEEVGAIVQKLADARLIITDEQAGKDTVTISHEKLIEAWPWLKKLVNENRDAIALQNEIASDAKEWDDHQHDPSYLYTGARLVNALEQLEARKLVLSGPAHEFVQAGFGRQQREQRARIISIVGAVGLVVAGILLFSYVSTTNANKLADSAGTQIVIANTAQAASTFAIEQQKIAQEKADEAQEQTKIALARQLAAQAQPLSTEKNLKQVIAVLLATQSMQWFPSVDAFQVLDRNLLAYHVAHMTQTYSYYMSSLAFSPDGKYVVSGTDFFDETISVWEVSTGKEVAGMVHEEGVEAVVFSPDGKYVASAGRDQTVRVWEASTGKEVARMTHEDGAVRVVAFSPNGKYVLSRGDKTVRVWEVVMGKEVAHMTHGHQVNFAAFSPDGRYIVSTGCDELSSDGSTCLEGSVRVWEALTGKEVRHTIQDASVSSVVLSLDGKYVVSGSSDGTARVWEAATGREISHLANYDPDLTYYFGESPLGDSVYEVAFSANGKYVVAGHDKTAQVWETTTGKQVAKITHDDFVDSVGLSPDGKYGVSLSLDGVARLWEATTGKEISNLVYETVTGAGVQGISSIAFSPDGKYVALGGCDLVEGARCDSGGVHVWELSHNKTITRMTDDMRVKSVAFSPDSQYVASAGCEELRETYQIICSKGLTRVWDVTTGKEVTHTSNDPGVEFAAFSPDGKFIVSTGCDHFQGDLCDRGRITVWGASSGHEITRIVHNGPVNSVAFSPNGKYGVSGGCDEYEYGGCTKGPASVWEVSTGKEIARLTHEGSVIAVAFSPDSKYVASGDDEGTVVVWDGTDGKEVARITHDAAVSFVAFSPDGKYVISAGRELTVHVWEAATGKEVSIMNYVDLALYVYAIDFSPDGKYVVAGGCDQLAIEDTCLRGSARVWDAKTGREIARMIYEGSVSSVAFSPDGKYVVSMGCDEQKITRINTTCGISAARVWEAATGQQVASITHAKGVTSVAFSPDGKYIVSGSVDGEVTIREYRPEDLIVDACSRVTRNLTASEWKQYVGDALPYQAVCDNLPFYP